MGTNGWLGGLRQWRTLAEPLESRLLLSSIGLGGMQAYVSGQRPSSIVAADVNGDGIPDLAVADASASGQISVHLNNGDGTFAGFLLSNLTGTNGAFALAAADFNLDGKDDLAVVNNASSGLVTLLISNGSGKFTSGNPLATGANPAAVAAADVNADGRPDMVVANTGSATVSVFVRLASGFAMKVDYSVGAAPVSVAAADLTGDGRPELVTANSAGTLSILRNNGNGTFAARVDYPVGSSASFVTIADVSGDGRGDAVVAAKLSSTISILRNNGDGTLAAAVTYPTSGAPVGVVCPDLNADRRPDLIVACKTAGALDVRLNTGGGTFGPPTGYTTDINPISVVTADFDADGRPDIAAAASSNPSSSFKHDRADVFLNEGAIDGRLANADVYSTPADSGPYEIAPGADLDRDGDADLAVAYLSGSVGVLRNNGDGTFGTPVAYATAPYCNSVAIADLNGDSWPDLVTANGSNGQRGNVTVLLGDGTGSFTPRVVYTVGSNYPRAVRAADLDGDGDVDLAAVNNSSAGLLSLLFNRGDGTFATKADYVTPSTPADVVVADVTRDALPDLVVCNLSDKSISVFPNVGGGIFGARLDYPCGLAPIAIVAGDFDADGAVDVGVADYDWDDTLQGAMVTLRNNGDGSFAAPVAYTGWGAAMEVATADLDGDRRPDLIAAYENGTFVVFKGVGDGTFVPDGSYAAGPSYGTAVPFAIAPVDADGDGRPDLGVVDRYANRMSVLLNRTADFPPRALSSTFAAIPNAVSLAFSDDVATSLQPEDLLIREQKTGAVFTASAVTTDPTGRRATFDFVPPLADGDYRAELAARSVFDAAGRSLAADYTFDFFILGGDANHDRKVDFNDLVALAQNYNTVGGMTFGHGDFNYDGNVDFNDLVILAQRYNTTLPQAPAAAPVAAPTAKSTLVAKAKPSVFSVAPVVKAPARPKAVSKPVRR